MAWPRLGMSTLRSKEMNTVLSALISVVRTVTMPWVCLGIAVVEMQRVGVHRQQGEPDIVGFGDGSAWPMLVDVADVEVLIIAAGIVPEATGADLNSANHISYSR
jgi:hypothetical protein